MIQPSCIRDDLDLEVVTEAMRLVMDRKGPIQDGTGRSQDLRLCISMMDLCEQAVVVRGGHTRRDALVVHLLQTMAADNPERLRSGLVRLSAMAREWIEALDARAGVRE